MSFAHSVPMVDGSTYVVKSLLGRPDSNQKIAKSNRSGSAYLTRSLSLAPASVSGFNLCASASHGCRAGCLFTAGFAQIHPRTIQPARIAKARFLRLDKAAFRNRLEKELRDFSATCKRKDLFPAIRLNVLSDVIFEREFPGLIESFPEIQFYDYTKHFARMMRFLNDDSFPANYHLTFSWSGTNEEKCRIVLANNGNVAVPFHVKKKDKLPYSFMGRKIVNGDRDDLRFLNDNRGVIIGLKVKGKARSDFSTGFVVSLESEAK